MRHDDRWDDDLLAAIHAPSALLAEALIASALVEELDGRRAPAVTPPGDEPKTVPLRPVPPRAATPTEP